MAVEDTLEITFNPVVPDDPEVKRVEVTGPSDANVGEVVGVQAVVYDQYDEPMPDRGVEWVVLPTDSVEILSQSPASVTLKGLAPGKTTVTGKVVETGGGGPPATWPPEGYVELLPDVTFEDGEWPAGWSIRADYWEDAKFALVDGNPITGGKLARHTYYPGNSDGGPAGFMISPRFTPVREVIVEEVMRTSPYYKAHRSGVNKNGYTINDLGQQPGQANHPHIWMTRGTGEEGILRPSWGLQGDSTVNGRFTADYELKRGEWYVLRWRIIFSPDEAVGRVSIWAAELASGEEPVLVGDWPARTSTEEWDQFFDRVQIRPIWGGRGDIVTQEMFKEWARVRVCGRGTV